MANSSFSKIKRILAAELSAIMLTSIISGCEKSVGVSQDPETSPVSVSEIVSETASDAFQELSDKSIKLLVNRERIDNGLITAVESIRRRKVYCHRFQIQDNRVARCYCGDDKVPHKYVTRNGVQHCKGENRNLSFKQRKALARGESCEACGC